MREEVTPKLSGTDLLKGIFKGIFFGGWGGSYLFKRGVCKIKAASVRKVQVTKAALHLPHFPPQKKK